MKEKEIKKKCERIRELKAIIKNADKELKPLQDEIKNYANDNDLKGDFHGIKLQQRHTFNENRNIEIATAAGINIPTKVITDKKTLEKLMKEKNLDISYIRSIAILI